VLITKPYCTLASPVQFSAVYTSAIRRLRYIIRENVKAGVIFVENARGGRVRAETNRLFDKKHSI
jgi:hypothetical protein